MIRKLVLIGGTGAAVIGLLFYLANRSEGAGTWFAALAGWAQAWGAVMAIGAAYAIARHQTDQERRRREETRKSVLKTLETAVEYGFDILTRAKDRLGGAPVNRTAFDAAFRPGEFAAAIETLERAPLYDLGMYEVTAEVIRFRLMLSEARDRLEATVEGMTAADRRACPELVGLHTQAFNLKQNLLQRTANPRRLVAMASQDMTLA